MKLGATGINLGQIGANSRPAVLGQAGLPLPQLVMKFRGELPELEGESHQDGFCTIHELRPKGLNQVEWRSKPVTTQRIRAQFNLRSNMGQVINKSVQNEPEPSQSQAGRPRRGRLAPNYRR